MNGVKMNGISHLEINANVCANAHTFVAGDEFVVRRPINLSLIFSAVILPAKQNGSVSASTAAAATDYMQSTGA